MSENTIRQLIKHLNLTSDIKLNRVVVIQWFERKFDGEFDIGILEKVMNEMRIN